MKRITISFFIAVILFACGENKTAEETKKDESTSSSTTSTSSSDAKTQEWIPVDSATSMKAMEAYGTPGPQHAMLKKDDGVWTAETKMWMAPDAPPLESKASVTNKMIMGGRYQQSTFKGDMMGMPFEGTSTVGYDNAKKLWVSSWIDNWSTGIMNMEGTWDEATKTASYTGKMICPANNIECDIKQTVKMIDD
ncbi:MAG: DUF1579 domain-containing protein, partial [Bacteroidota bacterium]